jgi:hypothetical protein
MPYQVVWKDCNVFADDGERTTLGRGDYLPDWVNEVQKSQLATFGAVRFVDLDLPALEDIPAMMASAPFASDSEPPSFGEGEDAPVGFVDTSLGVPSGSPLSGQDPNTEPLPKEEPPGEPVAASSPEPGADEVPSKYATKPEWEDYAEKQGMPREEAEAATKAELIAKFG